MKIEYNAPVVLNYTFTCISILVLSQVMGDWLMSLFTVYPEFSLFNPLAWFRLVSHVFGHQNWAHLAGNFTFILLLGPILEEKYGSKTLMMMILITALVTGMLTVWFSSTGLLGASGVVFMMILLSSLTNFKKGEIPLTFILIAVLFLGREFLNSFSANDISEPAHIIGGLCGAAFGFAYVKMKN